MLYPIVVSLFSMSFWEFVKSYDSWKYIFAGWPARRSIIFALCCSNSIWCILTHLKNLWLGKTKSACGQAWYVDRCYPFHEIISMCIHFYQTGKRAIIYGQLKHVAMRWFNYICLIGITTLVFESSVQFCQPCAYYSFMGEDYKRKFQKELC